MKKFPIARAALALLALGLATSLPQAQAAVSGSEQRVLDAMDPARVLADMQRIAASADGVAQGVGEGSVVSGSPEETALAGDLAQQLRALGLAVRIEEYPVRAYRYTVPRLSVGGADIPAISLHAAGAVSGVRDGVAFAHGNARDGTRLAVPLVDAGDGYAADYARIGSVRGKAVLVRREQRDWPPAQVTEAALHGAAAIVFYDHPSAGEHVDALRQDSLWAREQLPAVAISIASARKLQRRLDHGPLELTLESSVEVRDGHSRNVIGVLEGTDLPQEWVLVSGHYDRWFRGVLDNVSGTAAVLETARAMTAAGVRPRRSVMFMAVGSEEAGLEDPERDWLAGSYAFLQAHPEVMRGSALVFNLDGVGWAPSSAKLSTTADQLALQQRVVEDLGLGGQVEVRPFTGSTIDAWVYGVLGGAATNALITWDPSYSPLYHTQEDVYRPERFANMERDLRVLALAVARAATAERVTPALTALADRVGEGLGKDSKRLPGVDFAEVDAALAGFRAAAARVEQRGDAAADRLLMNVRHELVPWLFASNGDYAQVVRTGEYADRVGVFDGVLAALATGDRAAALKALDPLYEGRQCLRLSAEAYAIERGYWAGEGGWASRFGHRVPTPLPAFDQACRALAASGGDGKGIRAGFSAARDEALLGAGQAVALMSAKLRLATQALQVQPPRQ